MHKAKKSRCLVIAIIFSYSIIDATAASEVERPLVLPANCDFKSAQEVWESIKKNHPQLRPLEKKLESLSGQLEQAKQFSNPEIDIELSGGDTPEGDVIIFSGGIKKEIDISGKRFARIELAEATKKKEELEISARKGEILVESISSLYHYRHSHQLNQFYQNSIKRLQVLLARYNNSSILPPEKMVERETIKMALNDFLLKKSLIEVELEENRKHLMLYLGRDGICEVPLSMLPTEFRFPKVDFNMKDFINSTNVKLGQAKLDVALADLKVQNSETLSDIEVGPIFEIEKGNYETSWSAGIALTFDLPVFNLNGGAKHYAENIHEAEKLDLASTRTEAGLDLSSLEAKYLKLKKSLENTPTIQELQNRVTNIEALFKRGQISPPLVLEANRQLLEFANSRFEQEMEAVNTYWNIKVILNQIEDTTL